MAWAVDPFDPSRTYQPNALTAYQGIYDPTMAFSGATDTTTPPPPGISAPPNDGPNLGEPPPPTKGVMEKDVVEAAPPPQQRTYENMPGWEWSKLSNPAHTSIKYQFARAVQQVGMPASQARGRLQAIVDKLREMGVSTPMKVVGDDSIDFGDGYGPIDVITSGGQWWWSGQQAGTTGTDTKTGTGNTTGTTGTTGLTDPTGKWTYVDGAWRPTVVGTGTTGGTDADWVKNFLANVLSDPGELSKYTQFDDPASQLLSQMALDRVNRLSTVRPVPSLDTYVNQLLASGKTNEARTKELGETIRALASSAYGQPTVAETALVGRISDLQAPPYTAGQEAVLRAKAFDEYEKRRQATIKNAQEGVASRGFAPSSGLTFAATSGVNKEFEQGRTTLESALLMDAIAESQRRAQESTGLSKELADRTSARQERKAELEQMAQQAYSAGDMMTLNILAQVADIEAQMNAQADQQERERLIAAGIPVDLQNNNVQLALQILGQGGTPAQIVSALTGVGQLGNQQAALAQQASASKWGGLGTLASLALQGYSAYKSGQKPTVSV